jgi:hypothetical protein
MRMCKTGTLPTRLRPDADMSIIDDVRDAVIAIPVSFVASYVTSAREPVRADGRGDGR